MFNDLRDFITKAQEIGECRVFEGADWDVEIGTITDLMAKAESPLLLFDNIKGYPSGYRVVTNLVTSSKRVSLLWGLPEGSPIEMVKAWREKTRSGFKPVPPVMIKTGPVKENVLTGKDVDLFKFPSPKWHERDGGRYIGTGTLVVIRDPEEGWVNLGTYRVQIHDKTTCTIEIDEGHHGDTIRRKYWAKGLPCPAAVCCGQEPVLYYTGAMQVPYGTSEYDYAGWLRGKPVEIVTGATTDLPIPATAEIVLEGEMVPPEVETRIEGPFGEYTGYYAGHPAPMAAFRVKSILHRNDPILLGNPPLASLPFYWWDRNVPRACLMWEMIDKLVPGVKGVWIHESAGMPLPVISIEQKYAGQAKEAAMVAKTFGAFCRFIIVVDDDIDPSNIHEVLWALGTRCDPELGIDIIRDAATNIKDPLIPPEKRARHDLAVPMAIIMACKPFGWIDKFPYTLKGSPEVVKKIKDKWGI